MPLFPGEETLATVYADLHCYFQAPSARPFLHRFDKATYFYVYYNSTRQTTRIEVAINPGTPDQAAFNGYLDHCKIANSHQFPTRVTLTVDATDKSASPASARSIRDPDEWRLASADPRDAGATKYRIHTIDFYYWSQEDSKKIVDLYKKLLQPHQLELEELYQEEDHRDMVSPLVQNLENVAINDPSYHKDGQRNPAANQPSSMPLPPPPPPPPTTQSSKSGPAASPSQSQKTQPPQADYTPMAYNPAAPAAPEPIAHREDTPPPVDAGAGTGLAAAMHDQPYAHQQQPQPYAPGPGPVTTPYGHYGSSPPPSFGPGATAASPPSFGPQAVASSHASFGPHASPPGQPSFGPQATSSPPPPPPPGVSPRASVTSSFAPPPTTAPPGGDTRHPSIAAQTYSPSSTDPNSHIFGQQSVQSPGSQFYTTANNGQPHKPLQHVQPQYPDYLSQGQPGSQQAAYSNYQYGHSQQGAVNANQYDVHNQFYRPTEAEHHTHHNEKPQRISTGGQHRPSTTEKIDKGIGKLFKKIDKKLG